MGKTSIFLFNDQQTNRMSLTCFQFQVTSPLVDGFDPPLDVFFFVRGRQVKTDTFRNMLKLQGFIITATTKMCILYLLHQRSAISKLWLFDIEMAAFNCSYISQIFFHYSMALFTQSFFFSIPTAVRLAANLRFVSAYTSQNAESKALSKHQALTTDVAPAYITTILNILLGNYSA